MPSTTEKPDEATTESPRSRQRSPILVVALAVIAVPFTAFNLLCMACCAGPHFDVNYRAPQHATHAHGAVDTTPRTP